MVEGSGLRALVSGDGNFTESCLLFELQRFRPGTLCSEPESLGHPSPLWDDLGVLSRLLCLPIGGFHRVHGAYTALVHHTT